MLVPAAHAQQTFTINVLAEQWTTTHHPFTWTTAGYSNSSCSGTGTVNGNANATTYGNTTTGNINANGYSNSNCSTTFTPPSNQTIDIQKPVVYVLAESATTRMVLSCTKQVRFGSQCEGLNPGTFTARFDEKGNFEVQGLKGKKEEWVKYNVVQQSAIQHDQAAQVGPTAVPNSEPAQSTIDAPTTSVGNPDASLNSGFASRWKSMTSGSIHVLRFSGDYIYGEAILPDAAAKAGAFSLAELKCDPTTGGYLGKTNIHVLNGSGASCNFANLIELSVVTPDRIEGRTFTAPQGSKLDWGSCTFAVPSGWQSFTWIPVR